MNGLVLGRAGVVCFALLLGPTAAVLAQSAVPALAAPDVVPDKPKPLTPAEQVERHIARLHAELKITSDQTTQWEAFAQAMRDNTVHMEGLYQLRAQSARTMNAVESMKMSEQIAEAHAQDLHKLVPPFETLYDSMDDRQKKTADRLFQASAAR